MPPALKRRMIDPAESSGMAATSVPRTNIVAQLPRHISETFEDLRLTITCKICFRFLYEPYTNSCGHTFCYSCLCSWFADNGRKKTCPDCRAVIRHPPAPAFLIREMTQKFISRLELLPEGETTQQHLTWQAEEAASVEADKSNVSPEDGGLFKGRFHTGNAPDLAIPFRDFADGVDRCPYCHWEIEDDNDTCLNCGEMVRYDSGDDADFDPDDIRAALELQGIPLDLDVDLDEDENEDEDEEMSEDEDDLDGFVADDDDEDADSSSGSETAEEDQSRIPRWSHSLSTDSPIGLTWDDSHRERIVPALTGHGSMDGDDSFLNPEEEDDLQNDASQSEEDDTECDCPNCHISDADSDDESLDDDAALSQSRLRSARRSDGMPAFEEISDDSEDEGPILPGRRTLRQIR